MNSPMKLQLFENQFIIDIIKKLNEEAPIEKEKLEGYYNFVESYFSDELKPYIFSILFQIFFDHFNGKKIYSKKAQENYEQLTKDLLSINKELKPEVLELFEDFLRASNTILDSEVTKNMQASVLLEYFKNSKSDNAIVNFLVLSYLYNIMMLDTASVLEYGEEILALIQIWQPRYESVLSELYLIGERYYKMKRILNGG